MKVFKTLKYIFFVVFIALSISFFDVQKTNAYFQFTKTTSTSFTTATYQDLSLATDSETYGLCGRNATILLTVGNTNAYNMGYTITFSNNGLTYTIDGAAATTYTLPANGSKTHTIVVSGTTTTQSLTITVTPNSPYGSIHNKVVTFDLVCPVCTWGGVNSTNQYLKNGSTSTYTIDCTDAAGITSDNLTSSAFTVSNTALASVSGVTKSAITNGYRYTVSLLGKTGNGSVAISINGNAVKDINLNGNTLKTSESIIVDNTLPTNASLSANSDTSYTQTKSVIVTLGDTGGSGMASGASIKYGWSTSTTTEPSSYTNATLSYSAGATSTTFTASGSGLTGAYYLWVVPITYKDRANNSNTTTVKSTGTFKFDNVAPTLDLSVSSGTTYAKSKTGIVTLADTGGSGLTAGTYTIKYAWGTSAVTCANMTLTTSITVAAGATSGTANITIDSGTGAGKLYVCNSAAISDRAGKSLAASTTKNANMYLDNTPPVISGVYSGGMLYRDPTFASGLNSIGRYEYTGSEVSIERVAYTTPVGSNALKIKSTGEGGPGWGGFYFGTPTSANKVLITRIIANIPVGYNLQWGSNSIGTGGTSGWLTSQAGTGTWTEYVYYVLSGSSGTFSTTNYYYLNGGTTPTTSTPLEWYVAYATVYTSTDYNGWGAISFKAVDGINNISGYGINQSSSTQPTWTNVTATSSVGGIIEGISANGTYYVWAKDALGNVSNQAVTVSQIDTTPPTVSYNLATGTYNTAKTVTITPTDNGGSGINYYHVHVYKDGAFVAAKSTENITSSNHSVTLDSDGTWTVYSHIVDKAGNIITQQPNNGSWYYEIYVIDTTGPIATFTPNGNTVYAKSHSTVVEAEETTTTAKYLWTQTNGASAASGTNFTPGTTISRSTGSGDWYLCVYLVDSLGNSSNTCSNVFKFDNEVPVITPGSTSICLKKGSGDALSNFVTITDGYSGVNYGTLSIKYGSTSVTNLAEYGTGDYVITYNVTDNLGNTATQKSITFKIYSKVIGDQPVVTSGDGLYADSTITGRYVFKGTAPTNNYVTFAGSTWRIMAIEADGRYKLINLNSTLTSAYDTATVKRTNSNGYCTATGYGYCNAWGIENPDGGSYSVTISRKSVLNDYLHNTYLPTLSGTTGLQTNTTWGVGNVMRTASLTLAAITTSENRISHTGTIGVPSLSDYMKASSNSTCATYGNIANGYCHTNNWLGNTTLLSGTSYWLITPVGGQPHLNFSPSSLSAYMSSAYDGNAKKIYPVVYLSETTTFTGNGTSGTPYQVNSSCSASNISPTTCTVTTTAGYDTSKVLTINPSDTNGITYSWDNTTFTATRTRTITAAGLYSGYIKDSAARTNHCSITIASRTEYRTSSCTKSYSAWSYTSTTRIPEYEGCGISRAEAEENGYIVYYSCTNTGCGSSVCLELCGATICLDRAKYNRSCSSTNCSAFGDWTTTPSGNSCGQITETRTTFGPI